MSTKRLKTGHVSFYAFSEKKGKKSDFYTFKTPS